MEALRAAAAAAYYGDDGVMERLGYDAGERVRRGAEIRAASAAGADRRHRRPRRASPARAPCARTSPSSAPGPAAPSSAKELAEAGARVVLLEEGAQHDAADFTARPRDMLPRLYRDAAQHATLGRPPILLPLGRAVGGTTLVNSGTCFRTPDHVLARWRDEYGLDMDLAPHFERVERELNVAPVPPELAGANAHVARRGAEALGWSGDFVRRNVRGCVGSGVCAYGCPANAKQHVGVTYVPKAHAAGATTYTGVTARRLGRGGVECSTAAGGRLTVDAPRVDRRRRRHPHARAARPQRARQRQPRPPPLAPPRHRRVGRDGRGHRHGARRPAVVTSSTSSPADGIMLEGIAGPPDYVAMGLPVAGERHRELMERLPQPGPVRADDQRRLARARALGRRPARRPLRPLRHRRRARQDRPRAARRAVPGRRGEERAAPARRQPELRQASRSPTCARRTSS